MAARVDAASRSIRAPAERVYRAFAEPGAMEQWLPPGDMTGTMLHFDFRPGGSYRMRLAYPADQAGSGKTTAEADEVEVALTRIEAGRCIEQAVVFESEDPAFSGVMRMIWAFEDEGEGTRVSIRAEDVPTGISPRDHQAGLNASLANLAVFVEGGGVARPQ